MIALVARRLAAPLLFALALLTPPTVLAQVGGSTDIIVGTVTGADGRPLAGARVEVTSLESETTRAKTTNERGQYTVLFPDGGGQYRVTVRFIGMAPKVVTVARGADEDRLVADVRLTPTATQLSTVVVEAARTPPRTERPAPGSTERAFNGDQLARLPIDPSDPNAVALLAPGVVGVGGSDTTAAGFSVAGQRPDQNQVTLDGLTFGGDAVPQEAVRTTRVVTNTYDVSRGQFTGGQVATTTRGGTNTVAGTFTYGLREPHLQWTEDEEAATLGGARGGLTSRYTQHQLSGGLGGPIVKDRAFWFGSFQVRRRLNPLQSLLDLGPAGLAAFGADPDSAARFLALVGGYGLPLRPADVPDDRTNDNASAIARLDYQLTDDHSVMFRANWQRSLQEGFRIGALDVPHTGGEQTGSGGGAMVTLSSVLGSFLNEFRGYVARDDRGSDPYLFVPEGRVFLSSRVGDVGTGVSALEFGGNGALPSRSRNDQLELSDELSWLSGGGGHRFRAGGLVNAQAFERTSGSNRNGTFLFNTLSELEANTPSAFTRSLATGERTGSMYTAAGYLGDTWRRDAALQLVYGVRLEGSRYGDRPAYNADVASRFGRRTDRFPSDVRLSPRVGFTWTPGAGSRGAAGDGAGGGGRRGGGGGGGGARGGAGGLGGFGGGGPIGPALVVRGGVGEFRGRAPTGLFSSAIDATGLPSGEVQLTCIGDAVPTPDWAGYLADPATIPSTCADGGSGIPENVTAPNVTVFDPDFAAPRSWRGSLGVQRRLTDRISLNVEGSYAVGTSLYGVRDLNLDTTAKFTLAAEGGRPVYVPAASVVAASGAAPLADSRRFADYAYVFDVGSGLESRTSQVTASLGGVALRGFLWNASYTLSRSRDQSSATSGFGGGGSAFGVFANPTTAGNPNDVDWAASDFERRHAVTGSMTWLARPWVDLTSILRAASGSPYTPRVSGDINGDGARNDRAFVFDPTAAPDPEIAAGMTRLLASAPRAARECLREQLGQVAGRNSCRNGWTTTLDLQANFRPWLGARLQRRLQVMVTLVNPLAGADQLLHGADGLKGWGQPTQADPTLLQLRGFDATAQRYLYTVNERFGRDRSGRALRVNPFQVGLQARLQIGPDRQRERLQALVRGASAGGAGAPGGRFDLAGIVERVAPDPVQPIIAMRDTLGLSDTQVVMLMALSDTMKVRNDSLLARVRVELEKELAAGTDFAALFPKFRPRLQEARENYLAAVRGAERVLTPAQWAKLPEAIRNPVLPGRGGDGTGPRVERRARPGSGQPPSR